MSIVHFFRKAVWFYNADGLPCMNTPICGQATERIGVGGVTLKKEETTCKKCLASLNRVPKVKAPAKPKRVQLHWTNRADGTVCVSANQGDVELYWDVLSPAAAEIQWDTLRQLYPGAKSER